VNPVRFEQANTVMRAPAGMENCCDVHAAVVQWSDGSHSVLTAWRPTPEELVRLNLGEPVFLMVSGQGMPPVALAVGNPLDHAPEKS